MFCYLDKTQKEQWLPRMFDLLYENMKTVAPSDLTYEMEKENWFSAVSPALEKAPRQIILCIINGELVGFMQYYTRESLLMVEELQLKKDYQRTPLFYGLCRFLAANLPAGLQNLEAYADQRNVRSICLMEKLGMQGCEQETDTPFVHFFGQLHKLKCRLPQRP